MKDEVKIYDKLDKKLLKNLLFLLRVFINFRTFSTKTYYFKEWTTILHYQQQKIYYFLLFIYPHFFYENLLFYITNILITFLKLQKH